MVDVASASSFGYRVGALSKWATDAEDPLVTAIGDFPKRGILVCQSNHRVAHKLTFPTPAECYPQASLEPSLRHS